MLNRLDWYVSLLFGLSMTVLYFWIVYPFPDGVFLAHGVVGGIVMAASMATMLHAFEQVRDYIATNED